MQATGHPVSWTLMHIAAPAAHSHLSNWTAASLIIYSFPNMPQSVNQSTILKNIQVGDMVILIACICKPYFQLTLKVHVSMRIYLCNKSYCATQ